MLSNRSIRTQFLVQLVFAGASLIVLFSSVLYLYIQTSIFEDKRDELTLVAKNICASNSLISKTADTIFGLNVELITVKDDQIRELEMYESKKENINLLTLIYPYDIDTKSYLKITQDVTNTTLLLEKILHSIFIINAVGFVLILFFAFGLSRMLVIPIKTLTRKLSNMNEYIINPLRTDELPDEFMDLGETLNRLIHRVQNSVKYQKELFIGAAHELKTPLAVIKLKNQVTLIKKRESAEYIEAIKVTNKSIDAMNKITGDILNIGRQESAQLETPVEIDVIEQLLHKASDFQLLAKNEKKELLVELTPDVFMATLQVNSLNLIVQNFLQNALKFTAPERRITLRTKQVPQGLRIEVIDEGCGIDDTADLFAPFKRDGNKSGVGLGLFLAKSAADSLGADIDLKNRDDGTDGTVASLTLLSKLCCSLVR